MKSSELLRLLKQNGWMELRQAGSHITLTHPTIKPNIVFPNHGSHEVGKGLEKKLKKQAGIK